MPSTYVGDEKARLSIYTRLANLADASAVGDLMLELKDRYGELPEPALNLIYLVQIKLLAAAGGIAKITTDSKEIMLQLADGRRLPADALRRKFGSLVTVGRTQVRIDRARLGMNWLATLQDIVDTFDERGDRTATDGGVPQRTSLPLAPPPTVTVSPRKVVLTPTSRKA